MRVLLVDDHLLFRQGLVSLLKAQPDFDIVGEAGSVREAIQLAHDLRPDLVLMDFSLPDGTGLEATQNILTLLPKTKIVFLTVHEEDDSLFAAIRSGASGFLLKNTPIVQLVAYIRGVVAGEAAISPMMTGRILAEFSRLAPGSSPEQQIDSGLTERELEVLAELVAGATNQEIAQRLTISVNTVKNHVSNILSKLQLKNRRELVYYARRQGLVSGNGTGKYPG
jgi:DNA-binding NarL/FixJ family response regulator